MLQVVCGSPYIVTFPTSLPLSFKKTTPQQQTETGEK